MSDFWNAPKDAPMGKLTEETFVGAMAALQRQSNVQHMVMLSAKQSKAYKAHLARMEAWRRELAQTPRHRFRRRYKLRRKLGEKRASILVPYAILWRYNRLRLDWKYRNDPDW